MAVKRYPQVKNLHSIQAFQQRCAELGIDIAVTEGEPLPGVLATEVHRVV